MIETTCWSSQAPWWQPASAEDAGKCRSWLATAIRVCAACHLLAAVLIAEVQACDAVLQEGGWDLVMQMSITCTSLCMLLATDHVVLLAL